MPDGRSPDETAQRSELTIRPIGVVRSPFRDKVSAPRQPAAARDVEGSIELFPEPGMEHAVCDLDGWDHLWVIFWFHLARDFRPKVLPPRSSGQRRGVLATRSPHRPNPLGLSVVRLDRVEGLTLHIRDVDMLDGTPVLDIKPYVTYTDSVPQAKAGWLQPPDPEPGFDVSFDRGASDVLDLLRSEFAVDLSAPIRSVLSLGPQPHPYRRIKKAAEGFVLAVKDWRARFTVEGKHIRVTAIETGYRPKQLAGLETAAAADVSLAPHRAVWERFGRGSGGAGEDP